ncbi:MAG: element excision factor XisI family protein [Bacteroidota bacterium]
MDYLLKYKEDIKEYLESKLGFPNRYFPNLRDYVIVDETQAHFIHLLMGWKEKKYIYEALRHVEIKADSNIIIHQSNVDKPLHLDLIDLGIDATHIRYHQDEMELIESNLF